MRNETLQEMSDDLSQYAGLLKPKKFGERAIKYILALESEIARLREELRITSSALVMLGIDCDELRSENERFKEIEEGLLARKAFPNFENLPDDIDDLVNEACKYEQHTTRRNIAAMKLGCLLENARARIEELEKNGIPIIPLGGVVRRVRKEKP